MQIDPEAVRKTIIGEHVNIHRDVAVNTAKIVERFSRTANLVALDSSSPVRSADVLADALQGCRSPQPQRVLVDITTFTHETLLIAVQLLSRFFSSRDEVRFVYTIAAEYDPGTPPEDKWLSKGIEHVRSILGFPGTLLPGRDTHLILLHGFETERSKNLIAEFEPVLLSLGKPQEATPIASRHYAANRRVHAEVLDYAKNVADVREFSFTTDEPEACAEALCAEAIVEENSNVIVAPMNTKISTLGALLAARRLPRIQLCYAQPSTYNVRNYSTASDDCYIFTLPELFVASGQPITSTI